MHWKDLKGSLSSLVVLLLLAVLTLPLFTAPAAGSGASDVAVSWHHQFGSAPDDIAHDVASDGTGVYVAGETRGALPGHDSIGSVDAFLRKVDPDGTAVWTRQFGTTGFDAALAVATDGSAVYVAGRTDGALPGETSAGSSDAFLRKLGPDGLIHWTLQFGSDERDVANDVAADPTAVYVVGEIGGAFPGQTSAGGDDAFLRKVDSDGNVLWTRQFGTPNQEEALAVALDATGVYVVGQTDGDLAGTNEGPADAFLRRYDPDGNVVWTRQFGTPAHDVATGVATDATGVYVTGTAEGLLGEGPGAGSAFPGDFALLGSTVFFRANDGITGEELWRTDGTEAGTVRVKDIRPGPNASSPRHFAVVGSTLYFSAFNDTAGFELWKSDGTEAGTVLVKDVNPGTPSSFPDDLVAFEGALFFRADDGTNGTELWRSNGTEAGTVLVKDIDPSAGSFPNGLTVVNETLFFEADDGTVGDELWKTDGTEAGTVLVKDINPGGASSFVFRLVAFNDTLFFTADDGTTGNELWKSDGTEAGTVLVKDIHPSTGSSPTGLTVANDTLFFTADDGSLGNELWQSNGTAAGTVLVKDIHPGSTGSFPLNHLAVDDALFFNADDGITGRELWRSNGTAAGTVLVKDIRPGDDSAIPRDLAALGPLVLFRADDGVTGEELWRTDGTEAGTARVADLQPGRADSDPAPSVVLDSALLFPATNHALGEELWRTDGTEEGTALVRDIHQGAGFVDAFLRKVDANGTELWTRQFGTWDDDVPVDVATDGAGVYVAGQTDGVLPGQETAGDDDAFLRRYAPDGTEAWTRQFGTSSDDAALGVALDAAGLRVAGETRGAFPGQTNAGSRDAFLVTFAETPDAPPLSASPGDGTVRLTWTPPADGRSPLTAYRVYRGPDAGSLALVATVSADFQAFTDGDVTNGVTYAYAVAAVNAVGEGPLSAPVAATPRAPPLLTVAAPADGTITNDPTVTVAGTTEPDATVTVNGADVTVNATGGYSLTVTLPEGEHVFEVVATNPQGTTAAVTRTVTVDTTAPALALTRPATDVTVTSPTVLLEGTTDPDARVVANGYTVNVAADGTFAFRLPLAEGSSAVTVTATDPAGNAATVTRTVTYANPVPGLEHSLRVQQIAFAVIGVVVVAIVAVLAVAYVQVRRGKAPPWEALARWWRRR